MTTRKVTPRTIRKKLTMIETEEHNITSEEARRGMYDIDE
jgi:hypothetical protein